MRNPGLLLQITEGQYARRLAIAYHAKQEKQFSEQKKLVVDVFEDTVEVLEREIEGPMFKNVIKNNLIISKGKTKHIGFTD